MVSRQLGWVASLTQRARAVLWRWVLKALPLRPLFLLLLLAALAPRAAPQQGQRGVLGSGVSPQLKQRPLMARLQLGR